jgi:cholesterol oxidase
MSRLAFPISQLKSTYDVIVIGSGYGGSITASRMSRAGKKVCLLERGKEFQPGEYPNTFKAASPETQIDTPELHIGKKYGLFDIRVNKEINIVQGCGLGGTSLINANVGMEPVTDVLKDPVWPVALRNDQTTLQFAYRAANDMLKTTPYPGKRPVPAKAHSMKTAAGKMGVADKWKYTPVYVNFDIEGANHVGVDQKPCIGCGECCSGCNFFAKNTMIMNYLPDAKNHGAEIYTEVNVRFVELQGSEWKVHYNLFITGDEDYDAPTKFITAKVVVLAAGSLGSTELLLRSAQKGLSCSGLAGHHFSGNGDFLAFGYNNELRANSIGIGTRPNNIEDPIGPNIASIIDLRNGADAPDSMVIEEGVVPGLMANSFKTLISTAAGLEGKNTGTGFKDAWKKFLRATVSFFRGPYHGATNHTLTYLVMTRDDDRGQMVLEKDRLRIEWPGAGTQPVFEKVSNKLLELTGKLDGVYTRNPLWTKLFSDQLVTVHPLGGCIMGDDATKGVVNHKGQVFAGLSGDSVYEGLYISDGSIVNRPLGINPSLTISALAERNCIYIAKDRGWTFGYEFP